MKPAALRIAKKNIVARKMLIEALSDDRLHAYGKFTDQSKELEKSEASEEDVILNETIMLYDKLRKQTIARLNDEISELRNLIPREQR